MCKEDVENWFWLPATLGLNAERTQLRYPINPSPEKRQEQKAADLLDNQAAVKKMKRQVDEELLAFARFGKSGSLNCLRGNFQDVVLSPENLGIWSYMIRCDSLRINSVDNRRVSGNDAGIIFGKWCSSKCKWGPWKAQPATVLTGLG